MDGTGIGIDIETSGYAFRVTADGDVEVRTPAGACGLRRPTTQRYDSHALAAGALRALIELHYRTTEDRDAARAELAQLRAVLRQLDGRAETDEAEER